MNGRTSCFVSLLLLISTSVWGQELKKKLRGSYQGEIPAYYIEVGEQLLQVEKTQITIRFSEGNQLTELIGSGEISGTYRIGSETKTTMTLLVNYSNQLVYEELELDKKKKTIRRKGFYPQPECTLTKTEE